jgi:hypothetical protein
VHVLTWLYQARALFGVSILTTVLHLAQSLVNAV